MLSQIGSFSHTSPQILIGVALYAGVKSDARYDPMNDYIWHESQQMGMSLLRYTMASWRIRTFRITDHWKGKQAITSGFPQKGTVVFNFDEFVCINLNKLLNNRYICRWFKTPWHSCDITRHVYFTTYVFTYKLCFLFCSTVNQFMIFEI